MVGEGGRWRGCVYSIDILSFCYIIVHNKMSSYSEYHNFILDDSDGDSSIGGGGGVGGDRGWGGDGDGS